MIRSTFAGFTTAQLAMSASLRALEVAGQNIANSNTEGYTLQRLDIASLNLYGGEFQNSSSSIKIGYGVEMTGISQLRDPFLDTQYRTQSGKLGTTDAQAAGLEQIESVLDNTSVEGIRTVLAEIVSSLSTLSDQVGDDEFDTMVRSNMEVLLTLLHDASSSLEDIREDTEYHFETTDTAQVNELLESISELNTSIKNSQVLGNPALELQDQRNLLLDELSSYLPITVTYSEQSISPEQTVEVLDVTFTGTDGQTYSLISDSSYGRLDADITGSPITLSLCDAKSGAYTDITDTLGDGSLKGTLDFLNKSGELDGTDFRGLGYYEDTLDALVNQLAQTLNEANTAVKTDEDGNVEYDEDGNPVYEERPLFTTSDGSTEFTASNIRIADEWTDGTYNITASTSIINGEIGDTANDNILNIIDLLESSHDFKAGDSDTQFFSGSFYDCYAAIESTLGVDLESAETILTNQITVLNQTADSRDSISGVSLDEEGMNLMQYNQSYSAAARLMTTLDEMLDKLINETGIVGR